MSSLFRRGRKNKNKAKEPPLQPSRQNTNTNLKQQQQQQKNQTRGGAEEDDVKEVLTLFNRLEELVVDGDPRVKEALNQKPSIQNLLREDSMLSPRSYRPGGPQPFVPSLPLKEPTDTSLLSRRYGYNYNPYEVGGYPQAQRFVLPLHSSQLPYQPLQQQQPQYQPQIQQPQLQAQQIISPRRQVVVPPIRIPERTFNEDSFYQQQNEPQLTGRVRRHADGTVVATIDSIIQPEPRPIQMPTQQLFSPPRRRDQPNVYGRRNAVNQPPQPSGGVNQGQNTGRNNQADRNRGGAGGGGNNDPYHDFNYYNGKDGETSVRIVLDENRPDGKQAKSKQSNNKKGSDKKNRQPQQIVEQQPVTYVVEPTSQPPLTRDPLQQGGGAFAYRSAALVSKGTGSTSKVIGPEGGKLSYLGCSLEIPKNALKEKTLFRLMILDHGQIPHTTDRLYQPLGGDREPTRMPITPAVRIDPANVVLDKAATIKLPTCVAEYGQGIETLNGQPTNRTHRPEQDIKTDDIEIKLRGPATNELWDDHVTEVFRSADSVTFKLQTFGDVCAFHHETGDKERKALNKRLSVYLFKSSDNRKHQFLSILLAEDLPHVIQKAVESVPHWLSYTDSCFNIILPEGKNFVVYIEPVDRSLCFTEANVMEIPWQNLWYPETIIRKHVQVTLLNRDTPTEVQLILDEGNIRFNTAFMWQVPERSLILPDLLSTALETDTVPNGGEVDDGRDGIDKYNDAYKSRVKFRPDTPDDKIVTNQGILNYAQM